MSYEVVAHDWAEPNVIATFDTEDAARRWADRMDGLALRCYVRPAHEPQPKLAETKAEPMWEGYCALETVKAQNRCRRQCESCKIAEERRRRG